MTNEQKWRSPASCPLTPPPTACPAPSAPKWPRLQGGQRWPAPPQPTYCERALEPLGPLAEAVCPRLPHTGQNPARPWPGPPGAPPSPPRQDHPDTPLCGPFSTTATSNTSPSYGGHQPPQARPRLNFIPPQNCGSRGPTGAQFYLPGQQVGTGMYGPQCFRGVSPTACTPGHAPSTCNAHVRPGPRICVVPPAQGPRCARGPTPPLPAFPARPVLQRGTSRLGTPFPASPWDQTVRNLVQLTGPQAGRRQVGTTRITTTSARGWGQGGALFQPPPARGMVGQGAACPDGNSTPRALFNSRGCAGTRRPAPVTSIGSRQTMAMRSPDSGQATPLLSYKNGQATAVVPGNIGQATTVPHNIGQATATLPHNIGQATATLPHNAGQATAIPPHNIGQATATLPHNIGQAAPVLTPDNGQSTPASHCSGQAAPVSQKSEQATPHVDDNGQATLRSDNNDQATPASDSNGEAASTFQNTGQATPALQHSIAEASPTQSHNNGRSAEDGIQSHPLTSPPLQRRQSAQGAGANRPCSSVAGQSGLAEQLDVDAQQAGGVPHLKDSPADANDDRAEDVDRRNDESCSLEETPLPGSQPQVAVAAGGDILPPQGDRPYIPGPSYTCSHGQEETLSPNEPGGTEEEQPARHDQTETPGVHTPGDKKQTHATKGEIQKMVGQPQTIVGALYVDPTTKTSQAQGSPEPPRKDRLYQQEGNSVASEEDDASCCSSARKGVYKSMSLQPFPSTGEQLKDKCRVAGRTEIPAAWKHATTVTRHRRTKDTTVLTETRSPSAAQTQSDSVIHRSRSTPAAFPLLSRSQSSSVKPAHPQPSPPPSTAGRQLMSKSSFMTPWSKVNRQIMTDMPQVTDSSTCTEPVKRTEAGTAMDRCEVKNTSTLTRCFQAVVSRACQTSAPQVRETETMTEKSRLTAKRDIATMTEDTERDQQTMTEAPTHTHLKHAFAPPSGQTSVLNQSGASELHVQQQEETVGGGKAPLALPGTPRSEDGVVEGCVKDGESEHCAHSPSDEGRVRITIRVRVGKGSQARLSAATSHHTAPPASLPS